MFYIVDWYTRLIPLAALFLGGMRAIAAPSMPKGQDVTLLAACFDGNLCDVVICVRNAPDQNLPKITKAESDYDRCRVDFVGN
jgi:hypothetical protein